jgi:hypothetical protein
MSRFLLTTAIAGAALFVGHQLLAQSRPQRAGFAAMRRKLMKRMIDAMPEDSPPKLVMSILPRLQEQNDQILALLKEQTDLLRNGAQSASSRSRRRLGGILLCSRPFRPSTRECAREDYTSRSVRRRRHPLGPSLVLENSLRWSIRRSASRLKRASTSATSQSQGDRLRGRSQASLSRR